MTDFRQRHTLASQRTAVGRCSLSGQIPKRSRVSAVTRFGLRTASRMRGRLPAVHRNHRRPVLPVEPSRPSGLAWVTMKPNVFITLAAAYRRKMPARQAVIGRAAPAPGTKSKQTRFKRSATPDIKGT
jgi:hypothetical protein